MSHLSPTPGRQRKFSAVLRIKAQALKQKDALDVGIRLAKKQLFSRERAVLFFKLKML